MLLAEELKKSLYTGYIDEKFDSKEDYRPKLIVNDEKFGDKILTSIIKELEKCNEFCFSIAFITNSGICVLLKTLEKLRNKGVKGKIIASEYLTFTEPNALRRLLSFENISLKVNTADQKSHAKGYIFKNGNEGTVIIGSSNITQSALCENKEWNIRITSTENGEIYKQVLKEFDYTFNNATTVSEDWIEQYEKIYNHNYNTKKDFLAESKLLTLNKVIPNEMQVKALDALEKIREKGESKALLISATGTGKTYLSAFDVRKFNPSKFLFVIHRENIAKKAKESFERIFEHTRSMGILSGNHKEFGKDFIFTTVQTISKEETYKKFAEDHFDYIVIDEVHHSGADTYQRILNYFKPKFLLGMTATPENTMGYDIFKIFNHNIAYELRLNEALKNKMLAPFHYYGVADVKVDGTLIEEEDAFNYLVQDERVHRIIEASKYYGNSGNRVKGLIFCSRVDEANSLSEKFNKLGYETISLCGLNDELEREKAIELLETKDNTNKLDYIFSVDIFNEGIDIPSVNQVIMLRPTKSPIVFVQQLGRGLRKHEDKEYLVVIDFIGNYRNNYMLPIALFGDRSYNKERLRHLVRVGHSVIPGASTVDFEEIVEKRIFDSINKSNMSVKKDLIEEYKLLKYELGRVPKMMDFVNFGRRDPINFAEYKKGSYYDFVVSVEQDHNDTLTNKQKEYLSFCTKEIISSKRIEDVLICELLIRDKEITLNSIRNKIKDEYSYIVKDYVINSAINNINGNFLKTQESKLYNYITDTVEQNGNKLKLSESIAEYTTNDNFNEWINDIFEYGKQKFKSEYDKSKYINGLLLYKKYTMKQILRILNWEKNLPGLNVGGYIYDDNLKVMPVFVKYNKPIDGSETTQYDDHFIDSKNISLRSKAGRNLNSPEIKILKNYPDNGYRIPLFIKKSDDEGAEYYYMGDLIPNNWEPEIKILSNGKEQKEVKIHYELEQEVENDMYKYITT